MCRQPIRLKILGPALAAFAFACALAACGSGSGVAPSAQPVPALTGGSILIPKSGIYLGVYVNTGNATAPPLSALPAFEAQVGRTMALSMHYYNFYDPFPGIAEVQDDQAGRIPIESWNCQPPNSEIAAGNQDGAIRARADAIKAWGRPLFLRYMWEMNLPALPTFRASCYSATSDEPNGVFSPVGFIAAWDHIRAIFAQEHVTNVIWLWNASGSLNPQAYYPGASEVDWVGFDKYDDASLPFAEAFAQAYGYVAPYGKPVLIGETGAEPQIQTTFFAAAESALQTDFPLVKGFVYFDSSGFKNDWAFSQAGLAAFAAMAAQPFFNGRP
jgi:hypothetical protein